MSLKNNPRRQKLFQEKKAPWGACPNPEWACSSLRVCFPNAGKEEPFRSNQLHYETLTLEQYQSLFLQSVSTGTAPIPKERSAFTHYLVITVIQILMSFCLGLMFLKYICVPSSLLRQQGFTVLHCCFNYFPSVRSDLSSEQIGNQKTLKCCVSQELPNMKTCKYEIISKESGLLLQSRAIKKPD